jgi:hypothetical protein
MQDALLHLGALAAQDFQFLMGGFEVIDALR